MARKKPSVSANGGYVRQVILNRDRVPSLNQYPFNIPALRSMGSLPLNPHVTFIIGENGSGKSTLLEAIAVAAGMNPEGGSRNFDFSTRASHSDLYEYLTLVRSPQRPRDNYFLRAESFFNVATTIELLDEEPSCAPKLIDSYGGKSLHKQSHGESFIALLNHRFGGNGLYVLDEPEAALSPQRQMSVLRRIRDLARSNSQFVIATHSPIILAYPDALIYECGEHGIRPVSYEATEPYQVTKEFLNNPSRMLGILFED